MQKPIYVIGSSNTDMVVMTHRLPSPGETVIGGTFFMNPGGKGANQAVAAARLGGNVSFVARIGEDLFGDKALEQLKEEKIITDYIIRDADHPSGIALIGVDSQGENTIIVAPGANGQLSIADVKKVLQSIRSSAIILMQLEIPKQTAEFVLAESQRGGFEVILNPAPVQPIDPKLLNGLFMITPNESEATLLTGIPVIDLPSAGKAAKAFQAMGVKSVIITLGSKGAYLSTPSVALHIPARAVTAIDTTAAGDCFNGALAVALSEEMPMEKAVLFACNAASISVTQKGAQGAMPYRRDLDILQ